MPGSFWGESPTFWWTLTKENVWHVARIVRLGVGYWSHTIHGTIGKIWRYLAWGEGRFKRNTCLWPYIGTYSQYLKDVYLGPAVRVREEGAGTTQGRTLSVPAVAYRMLFIMVHSFHGSWAVHVQINAKRLHGPLVFLPNLKHLCNHHLLTTLKNTGNWPVCWDLNGFVNSENSNATCS